MKVTIHRLTLVTIFLAVPTLIASVFGMNVPLPFQESKNTVYFIILLALFISLFLVWYFQWKRLF